MNPLEQLLAKWEAGNLSPAELGELKQLLARPQARAELVGNWLLDESIHDTLRSQAAGALAPARAQVSLAHPQPATRPFRAPRRRFRWLVWHEVRFTAGWLLGAAAAACLALAGLHSYFQRAALGSLTDVRSEVTVEHGGTTRPAISDGRLHPRDIVRVPAGGAATVTWAGEATRLDLAPGSELRLFNPMWGKRLSLEAGALDASVASQPRWRPMIIATPQAEAKVVGTRFSLSATLASTRLEVLEGLVRLRKSLPARPHENQEVLVHAGETATAAPDIRLVAQLITGSLSSDAWAVPPGTAFADAPARGTRLSQTGLSAAPVNTVERLRGYLLAPVSGDYTFWIGTPNDETAAELWLSADDHRARQRRIAYLKPPPTATHGTAAARQKGPSRKRGSNSALEADVQRYPSQESAPQRLVEGRRYYLEIWHEGVGPATIALCWRRPGDPAAAPPKLVDIQALRPLGEAPQPSEAAK
ncbi:MAG TPA: FecR domain-containing protein [Dongiaceae bacterium]|nr:FecR domain-containing protein [Dongiaceae bacterium]